MKRAPLVEVTWEDAANERRWEADAPALRTVTQHTVGVLVERSNGRLVVAGARIEELGVYRNVDVIPEGMVIRVRRLR